MSALLPPRTRLAIRLVLVLLPCMLAACGTGRGRHGDPDHPNVLIVVTDTVRRDLLSAYGYPKRTSPFLEELARQGVRFDRAYSTSSWTLPSHASLFTGTLPKVHRAHQGERDRRVADSLPLLAEVLGRAGYETAGFSNNVWVSERSGLDRGFSHFENYIPTYRQHLLALAGDREGKLDPVEGHQTVEALSKWLEGREDPDRPFFCFVNIVEPHLPYLPPWSEAREFMRTPEDRWRAIQAFYPRASGSAVLKRHYLKTDPLDEEEWDLLKKMYEGELRVVDRVVRNLVGVVDEHSDPASTLVFVLADHGENLGDHGHLTHIFNVYDSNVKIPLVARGPGFAPGTVNDHLVSILDLYPTVLAAAGLRPDPRVTGFDLRGPIPEDRVVLASLEFPEISLGMFKKDVQEDPSKRELLDPYSTELRAAVGPRYKLIRHGDGTEEIYDLQADPLEALRLDAHRVEPAALERLRRAVLEEIGTPAATGEAASGFQSEEALKQIRDMGYAGDDDE